MTILPCIVCGLDLPPQKPGARRKAHEGECSESRSKAMLAAAYRRRKDADPERVLAMGRAANARWRANHPEQAKVNVEAWRAANPERAAEQLREWRKANPELVVAKLHRRRARLLDAFVEDVDRMVVWGRDNGLCGICGEWVDPELPWPEKLSKTLDHVVPLSRGGKHSYANAQIAHAVCNSRKNDRPAA